MPQKAKIVVDVAHKRRLEFGQIVRKQRQSLGLNQQEVARKARISPSMLSLIECGKRGYDMDLLPRFAEALKLDGPYFCLMSLLKLHPEFARCLFPVTFPETDPAHPLEDVILKYTGLNSRQREVIRFLIDSFLNV